MSFRKLALGVVSSYFLLLFFSPRFVDAVTFTRKVFLQNVTTNSIELRWVTDTQEQLVVKYGETTGYGSEINSDTVSGTGGNNNHAKITGLSPNTKYYYQIVTSGGTALTTAGDQNHYFRTSPPLGSTAPISFAFWGDSGNNSTNQNNVAKQVFAKKPDIAFIAGDIAYGYTTDFTNNNTEYFNHYSDAMPGQQVMSFVPFYVTCGNHETSCPTVMADHSLPGGGSMSGQSVYAFDYGNVHFVALNSNGSYSYPNDQQMAWALNNLRTSTQPWKVIFWHHNGWSAGSHSSDQTRQDQIGRLAQDGGAQIVFWGHSHVYERWNRKSGYYPNTQFFTIGNGGQSGSSSCTDTSPGPGCAGKSTSTTTAGFLLAQVSGNEMKIDYIASSGTTADTVTLTSNGPLPTTPPGTITSTPTATLTPTLRPSSTVTPTVTSSIGPEIIIDNDSGGYSETPNPSDWFSSNYAGAYGAGSRAHYCTTGSSSTATATWTATVGQSATWSVSAWWTAGPGRITDAKYQIYKGNTLLDTQTRNQQTSINGQFQLLGSYNFNQGDVVKVTLLNTTANCGAPNSGANDTVSADAVRLAAVSTSPAPSITGSQQLSGDANGDGKVDGIDYITWLTHYNQATTLGARDGDFNLDGKVDGIDYITWLNNYGNSLSLTSTPFATSTPAGATPTLSPGGTVKAFPGAEGYGANSVGGRGGKVIEVTNLNDSGTGSLRACVTATGPRICVFRVAGTIDIASQMNITSPNLTIAGQTAPGDGITLRSTASSNSTEGPLVVKAGNVIIRYIRSRPGPGATTASCCLSAIRMLGGSEIILDHLSTSWAVDDNFTNWFAQSKITVSWSISSEALSNSTHEKGEHSKGYLVGDHAKDVSVHHNLFASNVDRNPLWKGDTTGEFVNNVVYNWSKSSPKNGSTHFLDSDLTGPSFANLIGNVYLAGPNTPTGYKGISVGSSTSGQDVHPDSRYYVSSNIGPGRPTNTGDDWLVVDDQATTDDLNSPHRVNAFALTPSGITATQVDQVKELVLQNAGATIGLLGSGQSFLRRDSVDTCIVGDVRNSTGQIINSPSDSGSCGPWPALDAGTPYLDSDHDGMADEWETAQFGNLNRGSSTDSSSDFDLDGYTDLEEFLNQTDPKVKA